MMESAAVVAEKVIVLFIMIAVGYGCARAGALKEEGTRQLTNMLFYVVTPCLIVNSLQNTMGIVDQMCIRDSITYPGPFSYK